MDIRDYTPSDAQAVVDIHNTVFPRRATSVQDLVAGEQQHDPPCKHRRWMALLDGRAVGFGRYAQPVFDYHPQKFAVAVEVLPDARRRGIGAALYDRISAALQPFDPLKLRADAYGDIPEGVRFLEQRGFQEVFRETPLHLNVNAFDPAPYGGLEAQLQAAGIAIKTLRDLEDDPERDRKVYNLYWETTRDVPAEGEIAQMDFAAWAAWTLEDPLTPHDGYFIAVHRAEYVGISEFGINRADHTLQGGLVGVRRAWRNRGIALALQVRAIAYAREHGYALIKTSTAVGNLAMRQVYDRLGFARQPDWIQMERVCRNDRA